MLVKEKHILTDNYKLCTKIKIHGQVSVSDKAAPEDCEGQKKSKAELRAERRAIQVGTATG